MAQIPRTSVASILKMLLASAETDQRLSKTPSSRDYYDGRVSGLRTALDVLGMDEDDCLPPVSADQPAITN